MTENEVEALVIKWFRARGWYPRRQNVIRAQAGDRYISVGTRGQCDWAFIRPAGHARGMAYCEVEVKGSHGRPSKQQLEYVAMQNHRGIPAVIVSSIEQLEAWAVQHGWC